MSESPVISLLEPGPWLSPSGGPRYIQLRRRIQQAIESGALQENDPLPSERDIAAVTGLSRVTVRKAVAALVDDELVYQKQGSGSFVNPQTDRFEQSLSRLSSFTEDMARRGMHVQSRWLDCGVFAPSTQETFALGLEPDEHVTRLNRLRLANGTPMAIEMASTSAKILPNPQKVEGSLYTALSEAGHKPARAVQRISAINLDEEQAKLLGVPVGAAGLHIERVAYSTSGRVVERTISIYRGDVYDFVAELKVSL
ncbi:GntR family transcriptional regulator [Rhodobacteraceae bacterium RKSG542]|uniref:GntR family transcriptional regulator n=1 Tax=Pseudovibrio flavus TaxID=2529854 RepID=UPI0012BD3214|nr:GntR family transcriptional regulator [Pseudovibrio flavus]MTI18075.1 GntR family transcriptional regulator [Pseudovibrio flavus]